MDTSAARDGCFLLDLLLIPTFSDCFQRTMLTEEHQDHTPLPSRAWSPNGNAAQVRPGWDPVSQEMGSSGGHVQPGCNTV